MAARRRRAATVEEAPETDDAFEELEDVEDTDDLDELEDDEEEVEEEPPAKRTRAKAAKAPAKKAAKAAPVESNGADAYNTAWLAEHVSEVTGETIDSRGLRMLLRKMAADGELERTVGEDRTRYTFPKGVNDPTVKAVVRKIKSGDLRAVKREGLERVKKAATPAKKTTRRAAAEAVEEAPAKTTRRAKATGPAKATPRKRRAAATE